MSEIILSTQASIPNQPSSGKWKLFCKSTGLFLLADNGAESAITSDLNTTPLLVTSNYTQNLLYRNVNFDATGGGITITLLELSLVPTNLIFTYYRLPGGAPNYVKLLANGTEVFEDDSEIWLDEKEYVRIQSKTTFWGVV